MNCLLVALALIIWLKWDLKLQIYRGLSLKNEYALGDWKFENTMGNPFFFLFKILIETLKKFFWIVIWTFVFSVWLLPEVKNWFQKQISNKNVHITIQKKNLERFGPYLEKSKIGFPIVFSNFQLARADSFFRDRPLYT